MSLESAAEVVPGTARGRATRERIVAAAAELMFRCGVAGTSTPAVRDLAKVSSSQIYHYFTDKDALTRAVIAFQTEAILQGQAPLLAELDSLGALQAWRDFVIAAQQRQDFVGGCPLGSLSSERSNQDPAAREALSAGFGRWAGALRTGLETMVKNGTLRTDADPERLALALLTALQGGLLLGQVQRSTAALEAGLDTVIERIRQYSPASS